VTCDICEFRREEMPKNKQVWKVGKKSEPPKNKKKRAPKDEPKKTTEEVETNG